MCHSGANNQPPPDFIAKKLVPQVIDTGIFFAMTSLAAFGIVLSTLFLVFNIKYRHYK